MTLVRFRCHALRRSGATEVRVIQAASEVLARERLLAAGLEPVRIEPMGPSLLDGVRDWRIPRWRLWRAIPVLGLEIPRRPATIALCLLASIPLLVAIGAWSLAAVAGGEARQLEAASTPTGRTDQPYLSSIARRELAAALSRPTIGDIVRRLSAVLPQNASLVRAASDTKGILTIEIDTPDPDRLRLAISGDPLLGTLSEAGQKRTEDGAIRVSLRGTPR